MIAGTLGGATLRSVGGVVLGDGISATLGSATLGVLDDGGVLMGKLLEVFVGIKLGVVDVGVLDLGGWSFQDTCFTGVGTAVAMGSAGVGIVMGVVTLAKISASLWSACW
jgi:hypothetical protein